MHKQTQHHQRTFPQSYSLMQMASATKQVKYLEQLFIKNTRADIITIQDTKLNQSPKAKNIPHFTPIRTDRT